MGLRFTIIIPIKQLNDYVNETVEAVMKQSEEDWEILIVTNEKEDSRWPSDDRVVMLHSGRVGPADKRDMAAKVSRGKYLVFLDDDSYPEPSHLAVAYSVLEGLGVDAVGGPAITPSSDGFYQRVSGASFLSRISGGAPERYRAIGKIRPVDDWPSVNLIVRRDIFNEIGGFNSPYWPGEDTFLCWKLHQNKISIMYVPELIVRHHRRAGLRLHLKQIAAYGLHRGYFMRKYPETSRRLKYFVPAAVLTTNVASVALLLLIGRDGSLLLAPLVVYFLLVVAGAVEIMPHVGIRVAAVSTLFVVLSHHVYGFNLMRGLFLRKQLVSKLR